MIDERTQERLEHAAKVCELLEPTAFAMIVGIEGAALDACCCDMHRLLLVQKICREAAESLMNSYLKARRNATRN